MIVGGVYDWFMVRLWFGGLVVTLFMVRLRCAYDLVVVWGALFRGRVFMVCFWRGVYLCLSVRPSFPSVCLSLTLSVSLSLSLSRHGRKRDFILPGTQRARPAFTCTHLVARTQFQFHGALLSTVPSQGELPGSEPYQIGSYSRGLVLRTAKLLEHEGPDPIMNLCTFGSLCVFQGRSNRSVQRHRSHSDVNPDFVTITVHDMDAACCSQTHCRERDC